ncbi:DUF2637 domain-containing protein [Streptomyces mutabilis]|uniref:DUF2637 domain-containing protein n=1 Tax=Streptomyces mutabilis TaxID=67332 RepID=UPI000A825DBA|nr:DUF2637 domain-containing protein [Streptomyces mutabilis]
MERNEGHLLLNRTQRVLIAVVVVGAIAIAGIGFAGSYSAVRELAIRKGFGDFATVLPIGIDAGIAVLLALDLLLTWLRIPFPMLRQAAWLLTAATIVFNAAGAWPDPVGVGMHGVIPVLFVVTVEAARHAVGRLAAITADRHMEGVRFWRWLLAPLPTFGLWRRMKLWEIRKYDEVIQAEQQRLVYQARLRGRFGRAWRWRAPVDELLPLRIARYGVPLESPSVATQSHLEGTTGRALVEAGGRDVTTVLTEGEGASQPEGMTSDRELPRAAELASEAKADFAPPEEQQAEADGGLGEVAAPEPAPNIAASPTDDEGAAPLLAQGVDDEESALSAPRRSDVGSEVSEASHEGSAAPSETGEAPEASPPPRTGGSAAARRERTPDTQGQADPEHQAAVARLKSNAAAVRYAMSVLGSTHTPTVVDWLAVHGREVNRGQAHRITKEEERQQRGRPLSTVKRPF